MRRGFIVAVGSSALGEFRASGPSYWTGRGEEGIGGGGPQGATGSLVHGWREGGARIAVLGTNRGPGKDRHRFGCFWRSPTQYS
jgi:hypothetical protein